MAESSRYALPFLQAGQAQKEVTHNTAVAQIDALLQLGVESRQAATDQPIIGTVWIVGLNATGAWMGHDGQIAAFDDSGWLFAAPRNGCIAFVRDEDIFIHYSNSQWRDAWPVRSLTVGSQNVTGGPAVTVPTPSGGAVVDAEGRAAFGQLLVALRGMGIIAAS